MNSFVLLPELFFFKLTKLGFKSMWTKKSQMSKLDLEKAEGAQIKLPTSQKKQESSEKRLLLLSWLHQILWKCGSQQTGQFLKRWKLFTAAAAKSLQSCPTLWDPIDGSPPGSAIPGILQARTLEWVVLSFSKAWKWKVNVKSLSLVRLFTTPWTAAH